VTVDFGGKTVFMTNSQGFTANEEPPATYPIPKPGGVYRVVVIGGSTVMGMGAPGPGDSLPAALERGLRRSFPGKRVEVINAGVMGYTSEQELHYLESGLLKFDPDLVIAYDGINDFLAPDGGIIEGNRSSSPVAVAKRGLWRITHASAIARRLREAFAPAPGLPVSPPKFNPASVLRFHENHVRMMERARHASFKLAWFLQPAMGTDEGVRRSFFAAAGDVIRAERRVASNRYCIGDLTQALTGVSETVYVDTLHLNARGNELIARKISEELRKCGWITGP
jgi:lysophospholipase L1-like esterase